MEAELFHAGRQANRRMDIMKQTVALRNFANVPKAAGYNQQSNNIILKSRVALTTVMNKRQYAIACIGVCHHTSAADCYIYEQQNKFPF